MKVQDLTERYRKGRRAYPERFAQEVLGHNSKAVHPAYAKRALMKFRPWKIMNCGLP